MKRCKLILGLFLLAVLCTLESCERLDDSGAIGEVLEGTWQFSYTTDHPIDFIIAYERVVFAADGSCRIEYDGGALNGTFRAGDALIRIDYDDGSDQYQLLWRVLSFSADRITATYTFDSGGQDVIATVTLDKL